MSLHADELAWRLRGQQLLHGVSVKVPAGGMLGVIGPNGSGKSSLLKLLAGLAKPDSGEVSLDGVALSQWRRRPLARRLAVVEQHAHTEAAINVQDVVRLGRSPHRALLEPSSATDAAIVDAALRQVGMAQHHRRPWHSLSGGERQRTQIARALAQQPSELLLDEPTNHLDIQHQLALLALLRQLPTTCVVALHDLNLAARFFDRLVLLDQGRVLAEGTPEQVLTPSLIEQAYGVRAVVGRSAATGGLRVEYLG
ncbi:ABC transporter ATP-binding protein [Pseudomonas typographi]|uniref:ABC transporter ATP-binding protein n=1 Tax=Pseudomonas typographi TaxID=2715964 RepID=A0ABR7Z1K0_9PSED|nr:ABC transporter ATP-binding protein [Pseudomonas typographi]MBD1551705.1 ABC transporter ATP-binding protein [Pseudomonas typographi]MBD1587040.1 ABC transporter ATP-binding protein [Pseudomonas typographi]MBD1599279.1 ABC transporter ATP-binding protein [Pseudomonas typographi]